MNIYYNEVLGLNFLQLISGTKFNYSTYAYTLISCVMERASKMKFLDLMKSYFEKIGLNETYADEVDVIINNRSRYSIFTKSTNYFNLNFFI